MIGRRSRVTLLTGAILAACAGCGFKGPLYLPERNATVVTHPAPAATPPARTQTPVTRKKDATSSPEKTPTPTPPPPPP